MITFNNTDSLRLAVLSQNQLVQTKSKDLINDKGLAQYLILTPESYGGTPDEVEDFTIANGNIAALQKADSGKSAKLFGARGDGVTDDSDALQNWANAGGRLFLPRGVYRQTKPVIFPPSCTVYGESAGAGTGGSPLPELEQAASGVSMIRVSSDFVGDSVWKFVDDTFKHNASVVIQDIQILNDRLNGADAHLLEIVNGYDLVDVSRLNLMFAGPNSNALRVVEDNAIDGASIGQTLKFSNIVAIGDDTEGVTVPTVFMRNQQELQLIGVKAFGSAQAVAVPRTEAMWLEGCRGATLIGCSVAITSAYGLRVYSTGRSSDGIAITGMTYELCPAGGLYIDGTECDPGVTVSKVYNVAPRYQFPQPVACILKGGSAENVFNCEIDAATSRVTIESNVQGCLIKGVAQSNVIDNTAIGKNMIITTPNGLGDRYRLNTDVEIQKDTASLTFYNGAATRSYNIKYNASTANDYGFQMTNKDSGASILHEANGHVTFTPQDLGNGVQLKFLSQTGNKSYTVVHSINAADVDSGFFIKNDDTNSTAVFEPDGDLNLTNGAGGGCGIILRSADGTAYRITPANGGGSVIINPV